MSPTPSPRNRFLAIIAFVFVVIFAGVLAQTYWPQLTGQQEAEPTVATSSVKATLELASGPVEIELRPDLAPKHVEQITTLIEQGFYDGIVFHRVIDGFMAQTGDPTGTGTGGSDLPDLPAEFSDEPFVRGTIGMARSASPDSANSQFFIMFAPAGHLNGQYTVIGQVVEGMDHVDAIKKGDQAQNGLVQNPDQIISFKLAD